MIILLKTGWCRNKAIMLHASVDIKYNKVYVIHSALFLAVG